MYTFFITLRYATKNSSLLLYINEIIFISDRHNVDIILSVLLTESESFLIALPLFTFFILCKFIIILLSSKLHSHTTCSNFYRLNVQGLLNFWLAAPYIHICDIFLCMTQLSTGYDYLSQYFNKIDPPIMEKFVNANYSLFSCL